MHSQQPMWHQQTRLPGNCTCKCWRLSTLFLVLWTMIYTSGRGWFRDNRSLPQEARHRLAWLRSHRQPVLDALDVQAQVLVAILACGQTRLERGLTVSSSVFLNEG